MAKIIQHMVFEVTFRNIDAADPRWGKETTLTFGGVRYDNADGEPKDVAIMHCAFNVVNHADIIKEFGKVHPIPRTFKLIGMSTPSDQRLG